ncbi:MAG: metallophosphatase [Micrococcales bacterium 73-13]|nr:MAG: metallophosphatase [Micrococcales bacterium 73-13]
MGRRSVGAVGTALGVVAAAGAAALAWGALIERNRFQLRQEIVPVLAPGARPITVLHLSDLHMAPWQREKQDWLARIASITEPDLVVSTGDLLGHERGLEGLRRAFAPFRERGTPGAFVHGSNDYVAPSARNPFAYFLGPSRDRRPPERLDTAALERYLTGELGWLDLGNRARAIDLRGSRLELIGVDDPHIGRDRLDLLPGLVEEMREQLAEQEPPPERAVTVAVAHAPYRRVLDAFTTQGADLILAGHTHGGQVRVPGLPALVTNCDIPREQAQGLSTWRHARRSAWLEVSAGVGTSIYAPVRFACPPEAVVVTLVGGR